VSLGLTLVPHTFGQTETQNVKILNYSYYFDTDGYLEVVGQVQNVGSNTLDPVYLTGSVQSASGTDLSDSYCKILVAELIPQEIAPFNMEFMPLNWGPLDISSIVLNVGQANVTSSYQYTDLKITSSSATIGTSGNFSGAYLVNGVIQNTGSQTAQNVSVVATFYNSSGTVIAVGYNTVFLTYSLAPSATIPFQVPAYDLNQSAVPASEKISSYSLLIQAQGPILQGTPPVFTSNPNAQGSVTQTGGSSPTSSPTSSPSTGTTTSPSSSSSPIAVNSNSASNPAVIGAIVIVVVLIAVAGTILVLRKSKPHQTVKQAKKARKN